MKKYLAYEKGGVLARDRAKPLMNQSIRQGLYHAKFEKGGVHSKAKILMKEGYGRDQAYAIAYSMKRRKGQFGAVAPQVLGMLGTASDALAYNKEGDINPAVSTVGGALKGAGMGFTVGGPIGAAVGGLAGGVVSLLTAKKRKKEIDKAKAEMERGKRAQNIAYGRAVLRNYPTQGVEAPTSYYGYGGMKMKYVYGGMNTVGGRLNNLSNNMYEVEGRTHAQGGVHVGTMEVENDEVMIDTPDATVVLSDKLKTEDGKTYAEHGKVIAKRVGKAEKAIGSDSPYARNTGLRNKEIEERNMTKLIGKQIKHQLASGISPFGTKAQTGAILAKTAPYLDNVVNAIIAAKTPQIPEPEYLRAVPLNTDFDIRPQMAEIDQQVAQTRRAVSRSTSSGGTRRGAAIAAGVSAIGARNRLMGQKRNVETQLENQDKLNRQQILAANTEKLNQYNWAQMQRTDDIHARISANAANLAEDVMLGVREERLRNRDLAEIELLRQRYQDTGVMDRKVGAYFDQFIKGEITYEQFQRALNEHRVDVAPRIPTKTITATGADVDSNTARIEDIYSLRSRPLGRVTRVTPKLPARIGR